MAKNNLQEAKQEIVTKESSNKTLTLEAAPEITKKNSRFKPYMGQRCTGKLGCEPFNH